MPAAPCRVIRVFIEFFPAETILAAAGAGGGLHLVRERTTLLKVPSGMNRRPTPADRRLEPGE